MEKNTGFTLIEVLVSTVVLAVGLLGLAAFQSTSLKNNQSAYNRSQATQLAYDLADRMRANKGSAGNYVTTFMAPTAAAIQTDCKAVTTTCTGTDMAQNDLFEWNAAMNSALPAGASGNIAVTSGVYTITINWDDNRDGNVDANDPNFQMSFQL